MSGRVFEPATLGPVRLRNRIIKAATFEGLSRGGLVSDALVDFHRTYAAGGVGMTTLAYCAVAPDGRGAPNEVVLTPQAVPGLARLADAVHAAGAAVCAQIGHAGPVATTRVTGARSLSASAGLSPLGTRHFAMTAVDIDRVTEQFGAAANLLHQAGFDAIEIHMGHHYLLNAFLSPRFNRRRDEYGGDVANRVRFPRAVARAVRAGAGDAMAVTAKWEMVDGVRNGLDVEESLAAARLLAADRTLDALELTGGGSLANVMYLFRGDVPRQEFAATLPPAQRLAFRILGGRFLREYPFQEAYFLPLASRFLTGVQIPLILLGGITALPTMEQAIDAGFSFVALARALLREPDLPNRLAQGEAHESMCTHCNKCLPTIYSGTRCVLVSPTSR